MSIGGFFSGFSPTSFLASAARLIPGYMDGRRQAIADNWTDLMNYNQVQKGQISNLFDIATFAPDIRRANAAASNAEMGMVQNSLGLAQSMAGFPGQMDYYNAWSMYAPYSAPLYFDNQYRQGLMMNDMFRSGNPMALRLPSSIGVGQ